MDATQQQQTNTLEETPNLPKPVPANDGYVPNPLDESAQLYLQSNYGKAYDLFTKAQLEIFTSMDFFSRISRYIAKVPTTKIPTAGVGLAPGSHELVFYWNPNFFSNFTLAQVKAVQIHEFYHVTFNHLTARKREPHNIWNIATDLAINSIIFKMSESAGKSSIDLPGDLWLPGKGPSDEQMEALKKQYDDPEKIKKCALTKACCNVSAYDGFRILFLKNHRGHAAKS